MKKILQIFIILPVLLNVSCATIFTGTSENVNFSSTPEGAKVVAGGGSCRTPCVLRLDKGEEHQVNYYKDGYMTASTTTSKEFNPISLLNFLGLVGWIVDFGTGAVWKVKPTSHSVALEPKSAN